MGDQIDAHCCSSIVNNLERAIQKISMVRVTLHDTPRLEAKPG